MEFTEEQQAHIDQLIAEQKTKWEAEVLKPVQDQVAELEQYKPKEKTDAEKALEQKQQELWQKEVALELKSNNLEEFADFIHATNADELKENITKLNKVLKAKQLDNNFVPDDRKQQSQYDIASKTGNVTDMIGAKLSGLFK